MKNLKALIKIERTPVLFMSIYFLLINVVAAISLVGSINSRWKHCLARGIIELEDWNMADYMYPITMMLLIGYGLGMFLLVCLQFKKDKSIEISRFIKALPYTNGQRSAVKIGLGILSFTIPFMIYILICFMARGYEMNLFGELYRATAFEEVVSRLNRPGVYLSFMGMTYVRMLSVYLIFIMCEYLMSYNTSSLIVAALSAASPVYLYVSCTYDGTYQKPILDKIGDWIYAIYMDYTTWGEIKIAGANSWDTVRYKITENGAKVFLVYLVLLAIFSLVIRMQVKKQHIENADLFMPGKVTRYIFIAGVAICGACLMRDIARIVLGQIAFGYSPIVLYPFLGMGLVLGGIVATKIAHIGMQLNAKVDVIKHKEEV